MEDAQIPVREQETTDATRQDELTAVAAVDTRTEGLIDSGRTTAHTSEGAQNPGEDAVLLNNDQEIPLLILSCEEELAIQELRDAAQKLTVLG